MGISALQKASKASFELDEVKVTFIKDISTTVSDVVVSGRLDEMLNLPRWIARALEADCYVTISEDDMFSMLKQAMSKENAQDDFQLATLDDNFYIRLEDYMSRLENQKHSELLSMLNSLVRSRIAKISRLVVSSKLNSTNAVKLTIEEKELYTELRKVYEEFIEHVMGNKK